VKSAAFIWGGSLPVWENEANLVLFFGPRARLADRKLYSELRAGFPKAAIAGCSTGGQICERGVEDGEVSGICFAFDRSTVRLFRQPVTASPNSFSIGVNIGEDLYWPDLAGIIVLSDGLSVNGSELAEGIASILPPGIPVAGGMAGDGDRFEQTLVAANCSPTRGLVAAVGLYGPNLRLQTGHGGGWTVFGPRRQITHSDRNILYELEGKPALDLYETYLGPEAGALPGSGLRFPLLIRDPENPSTELIRTLLAVDRSKGTITCAGNLPQGWTAQLMRANFSRLTDGAASAARSAIEDMSSRSEAGLLISCIGRRRVLGQRTEDEVEAVRQPSSRHGLASNHMPEISDYFSDWKTKTYDCECGWS